MTFGRSLSILLLVLVRFTLVPLIELASASADSVEMRLRRTPEFLRLGPGTLNLTRKLPQARQSFGTDVVLNSLRVDCSVLLVHTDRSKNR